MTREEIIATRIKDKQVLDIGSCGQTDKYSLWNWYKTQPIKELIGIDLENAIDINRKIFNNQKEVTDSNIVYGNMETYNFQRTFDTVVAGDVIEHVYNQGLFLSNIHKHLNANGRLIITTPNAKWPTVFLKPNPTHSLWHDIYTLSYILRCHSFEVENYYYYYGNKHDYNPLEKLLILRQSLIFVCKKAEQR